MCIRACTYTYVCTIYCLLLLVSALWTHIRTYVRMCIYTYIRTYVNMGIQCHKMVCYCFTVHHLTTIHTRMLVCTYISYVMYVRIYICTYYNDTYMMYSNVHLFAKIDHDSIQNDTSLQKKEFHHSKVCTCV